MESGAVCQNMILRYLLQTRNIQHEVETDLFSGDFTFAFVSLNYCLGRHLIECAQEMQGISLAFVRFTKCSCRTEAG